MNKSDKIFIAALIRKFHEARINHSEKVVIWGTGSPRREFLKNLGWQAGISLEDGVRETYDWFVNKSK